NPWLGYALAMEKKAPVKKSFGEEMEEIHTARTARPSALLDTRVIYCGDYLEQLRNLPDACVAVICFGIECPRRGRRQNMVSARPRIDADAGSGMHSI